MSMDKQIVEAADDVLELCMPEKMSKQEALDFLEGVIERLESSAEALREEIQNDEDDKK